MGVVQDSRIGIWDKTAGSRDDGPVTVALGAFDGELVENTSSPVSEVGEMMILIQNAGTFYTNIYICLDKYIAQFQIDYK